MILSSDGRDAGPRDGGATGSRPDAGPVLDSGPCNPIGENQVVHRVLDPGGEAWDLPDVTMPCPTVASGIETRYTPIVLCNGGLAARFDVVVEGDGSSTELDSPILFFYDEATEFTECADFDDGTGRADARLNVRMGSSGFYQAIVSRRVPPSAPAGFTLTITRVR